MTTLNLARSLKPTGRLNADDIKRAGNARKEMSLSEIKKTKILAKKVKDANERIDKIKRPSSRPTSRRSTSMTKALGPLRPIRERSQTSRLIRANVRKPKR